MGMKPRPKKVEKVPLIPVEELDCDMGPLVIDDSGVEPPDDWNPNGVRVDKYRDEQGKSLFRRIWNWMTGWTNGQV